MVDADILRAKSARVAHHCSRLEARRDLDVAALNDDEDLRNSVLMDLQQAIQACIDLATHACADAGFAMPSTSAEAFLTLAHEDIIEDELARRLVAASGLRNLIVHRYDNIDLDRALRTIRDHLSDLPAFVRRLRDD